MGEWSLVSQHQIDEMCEFASTTPKDGVFVEFGVYRGGSAVDLNKVVLEQGREFHLFDTFEGIPVTTAGIDDHVVGDFSDLAPYTLETIKERLPNCSFHVGIFPDTMPKEFPKIAFVHIDADQYESYKAAFKYFVPLMLPGGIMWLDDYGILKGATQATDEEFPADRIITTETGKRIIKF